MVKNAYFTRRQSTVASDDSWWFHDEGQRIFFEKLAGSNL
jgi:hypothetical protein